MTQFSLRLILVMFVYAFECIIYLRMHEMLMFVWMQILDAQFLLLFGCIFCTRFKSIECKCKFCIRFNFDQYHNNLKAKTQINHFWTYICTWACVVFRYNQNMNFLSIGQFQQITAYEVFVNQFTAFMAGQSPLFNWAVARLELSRTAHSFISLFQSH